MLLFIAKIMLVRGDHIYGVRNIKSKLSSRVALFSILAALLIYASILIPHIVFADSLSLSSGYSSTQKLQVGSLTSLDPKNNQNVVSANVNNVNNLAGVVINQNNSNISFDNAKSTYQVGTSGVYSVNVSTINGNISKGDRITASIIEGIGMRASSPSRVIGTALDNFDSKAKGASQQSIDHNRTIFVGQILVNVAIGDFSGIAVTNPLNPNIAPYQNFFQNVLSKKVSQNQTVTALTIISVGLIITILLILISTIISMRSIGRNPLARKGITRHTILIIVMVTVILCISLITAYLVMAG